MALGKDMRAIYMLVQAVTPLNFWVPIYLLLRADRSPFQLSRAGFGSYDIES